jgi:hypothetical protein
MYFVTIDVARRLEDAQLWRSIHYVRAQARLRPEAGSAIEPIGGGYALFAGLGSPVNTVRGLGMHGPASPADIEQAEAFGCGAATWLRFGGRRYVTRLRFPAQHRAGGFSVGLHQGHCDWRMIEEIT